MRLSAIRRSLGPAKETLERNSASPHNAVGTVVSQVTICVWNQFGFQVLRRQYQVTRGDPNSALGAPRFYGAAAQFHLSDPWAVTFSTGGSCRSVPSARHEPIKPPHLRRRSHSPAPDHHCIFGGDTAIADPASPPLGAPLGPSAGSPLGAQLEVRRAADRRTFPVLPVLLRTQALGWVGEEEL
ncbi:hypothetical protein NDU88_008768 [Pleurodeles waltl]|uniref:Uncharacterized protein n=1 Tax=Pleurodeles waltl TaxID=8319 RepID=A0AAV7QVI0_PLEWA|nr:hypothetical protein NDU88_008768 [Pleurodeles waltl]